MCSSCDTSVYACNTSVYAFNTSVCFCLVNIVFYTVCARVGSILMLNRVGGNTGFLIKGMQMQ